MLGLALERNKEISLSRQLFQQIKRQILEGGIRGGQSLPSTRELAGSLSVSRNTVVEAYELLRVEGYIESQPGMASRVPAGLDIGVPQIEPPLVKAKPDYSIRVDFKTGQPDLKAFPKYLWNKLLSRSLTELRPAEFGYGKLAGYPSLRREISAWLQRHRGLKAGPENIFICPGATTGLFLLSDLLKRPNQPFAVENPSHPGFQAILELKKYPVRWAEVDEGGLLVERLDPRGLSAVYVTPSHQFPLGGILEAGRRTALIRLAREHDFHIIEDDYDSEFRYHGPPISPLYSLDPSRVIYVGTFSKTMYPALRIGFVILPPSLHKAWLFRRKYLDVQNPVLEQAALAEFIRLGKLDRHVRKMSRLYAAKRQSLLKAIENSFKSQARAVGQAAGLHVAVEIKGADLEPKFIERCLAAGVKVSTVPAYCPQSIGHDDKLLLGYGHLSPEEIEFGVKVLAENI